MLNKIANSLNYICDVQEGKIIIHPLVPLNPQPQIHYTLHTYIVTWSILQQ